MVQTHAKREIESIVDGSYPCQTGDRVDRGWVQTHAKREIESIEGGVLRPNLGWCPVSRTAGGVADAVPIGIRNAWTARR
jgi:hypothetical protein